MTEEKKEQPKEEKATEPDVPPEPKEEKVPEPPKAEISEDKPPKGEKAPEPPKAETQKEEPPKEEPAKPAKEEKKTEEAAPEDKPTKEEPTKEEKKAEEAPEAKPAEPKEEKKEPAPEEKKKPEPKETPDKPPEKPEKPPAKPKEDVEKKAPKPKETKKDLGIPAENLFLFGKYDVSEVVVNDAGLARYINLDPVSVPHSGAKHANRPFAKAKISVVERLINNMMRTGDITGKKTKTYKVVMKAFDIIGSKTKKNPVQVFINAIENSTPREEVTRLRYGGVSVPKAVDTSSSRRLDIAIRNICKGTVSATHKNTKSVEVCLANEIMLAAKSDMNSFAIAKKEELERIASSAR